MGNRSNIALFARGGTAVHYYSQWHAYLVPDVIERAMKLVATARALTPIQRAQDVLGIALPAAIAEVQGLETVRYTGDPIHREDTLKFDLHDSPVVLLDPHRETWSLAGQVHHGGASFSIDLPMATLKPPCAHVVAAVAARYDFHGWEQWTDRVGSIPETFNLCEAMRLLDAAGLPSLGERLRRRDEENDDNL